MHYNCNLIIIVLFLKICIQKLESQKTTETDDDFLDDDFSFNDMRVNVL